MKKLLLLFILLAVPCWAQVPPPPAASQAEVNAGTVKNKYVSPFTLNGVGVLTTNYPSLLFGYSNSVTHRIDMPNSFNFSNQNNTISGNGAGLTNLTIGTCQVVYATNAAIGASTHYADILTIAITPGDYDLTANFTLSINGATFTSMRLDYGFTTIAGDFFPEDGTVKGANTIICSPTGVSAVPLQIPPFRFNTPTNATIRFKLDAEVYTVGSPQVSGNIMARCWTH